MKAKLILFFSLIFATSIWAQTNVFQGNSTFPNDKIYSISKSQIERMLSPANGVVVYSVQSDKINFGRNSFDIAFTIGDNKIFNGNSKSSFDLIYELKDNKVYLKEGSAFSKCLYTFENGKIYLGDSNSVFDQIMSYELDPKIPNGLMLIVIAIGPL